MLFDAGVFRYALLIIDQLQRNSTSPIQISDIRLWYFCGQTKNRRSFHCGDSLFGGPEGNQILELHGYEPNVLPS